MWAIFWRTLKDRRTSLIIYCAVGILLIWMYVSFFPAFKDQSASLEQLIKTMPESFMKAFNFDINSMTTVGGFLSTEQYSFMWPLLLILVFTGFGGAAIAGEIERGTIEILLAQPISRLKLFLGRYLAGLAILVLFILFTTISAVPIIALYNIDYQLHNFVTMMVLGFIFGWAIYSLAMFFTSIFSDKGKVYFLTGGLIVVMYVLNIVASIKENLSDLKYFSFFYYFNPPKALIYNQIDHWAYLVFIGVALVSTILGAIWFTRRDIAV